MFGRAHRNKTRKAASNAMPEGEGKDISGYGKAQKEIKLEEDRADLEERKSKATSYTGDFDDIDFEDEFVMKGETKKQAPFKGVGGFEYTQNEAGDYEFVGPDGKKGVAKKGTKAYKSIFSEMTGGGSLYGTEGYAGFKGSGDSTPSEEAEEAEESEEAGEAEEALEPDYEPDYEPPTSDPDSPEPQETYEDYPQEDLPVTMAQVGSLIGKDPSLLEDPNKIQTLMSQYDPAIFPVKDIQKKFINIKRAQREYDTLAARLAKDESLTSREDKHRMASLALSLAKFNVRPLTELDMKLYRDYKYMGEGFDSLNRALDGKSRRAVGQMGDAAPEDLPQLVSPLRRVAQSALLRPLQRQRPEDVLSRSPRIKEEAEYLGLSGDEMQEFLR